MLRCSSSSEALNWSELSQDRSMAEVCPHINGATLGTASCRCSSVSQAKSAMPQLSFKVPGKRHQHYRSACSNAVYYSLFVLQPNLAKRLFDKRQFCSKRPASRDFRSLCAHSVAVSLSDRNTVSERFLQLPVATAY